MQERTLEFDTPTSAEAETDAVRAATERAERAESELAALKAGRETHTAETTSSPAEKPEGEAELRKDPMMAKLLDALAAGEDIGHYGRLIFAMVARHFLSNEEVMRYLVHDRDFSQEQAHAMLLQVESRDYSPPRRERLAEWQAKQSFQFMDMDDPDSGNLYRNLEFPRHTYDHIEHYQEEKAEVA